jgi:hypothetical protein
MAFEHGGVRVGSDAYHTRPPSLADRPMRAILTLLLIMATRVASADEPALVAEHAWIREAPPGAEVLAGYVELVNRGTTALAIVDARSADFERVELHAMTHADGVMRMRPLARLDLEPGQRVALEPGANHLMLIGPERGLRAGDRADVVLICGGGVELVVPFEVRR